MYIEDINMSVYIVYIHINSETENGKWESSKKGNQKQKETVERTPISKLHLLFVLWVFVELPTMKLQRFCPNLLLLLVSQSFD